MGRDAVGGNRERADREGKRLHLRLRRRCERCGRHGDGEKAAETTHGKDGSEAVHLRL